MSEGAEAEGVPVTLARLEGKIDTNFTEIRGALQLQAVQLSTSTATVTDHETRIRRLEKDAPTREELGRIQNMLTELNRWRWKMIGAFAAISAIVTVAVAVLEQILFNH